MKAHIPLEHDKYYHIYNRGINSCNLYNKNDNYSYFLDLYDQHVAPIADTFTWVLMPIHFLIRIKEKSEIDLSNCKKRSELKAPHQYLSNLFNAYSKSFNNQNKRHGALFERPFQRKQIEDEHYFRQVVLYIHNNPVHHDFCNHPNEYKWSSYLTCISSKPTKLNRKQTIEYFGDRENFIYMHQGNAVVPEIEEWLEL